MASIQRTVAKLNKKAKVQIRKSLFHAALGPLKEAEGFLNGLGTSAASAKLKAKTYNLLGYCYDQVRLPHVALKYFQRVSQLPTPKKSALSQQAMNYLHLCNVQSELGEHQRALDFGLQGIALLESEPIKDKPTATGLVVAYYNTAIEYEFLKQYEDAVQQYSQAKKIAEKYLGPKAYLLLPIGRAHTAAQSKLLKHAGINSKATQLGKHSLPASTTHRNSQEFNLNQWDLHIKKQAKPSGLATMQLFPSRYFTGDRLEPMFDYRCVSARAQRIRFRNTGPQCTDRTSIDSRVVPNRRYASQVHSPRGQKYARKSPRAPPKTANPFLTQRNPRKTGQETKAAIKIQRCWRMHRCQVLYKNIREAAIYIQRAWRTYKSPEIS